MVDLRASFDLRTGMLTTRERIAAATGRTPIGAIVPGHLGPVVSEAHPTLAVNDRLEVDEPVAVVNGRLLSPPDGIDLEPGTAEIDPEDGSIRRAVLDQEAIRALISTEGPIGEAALPDGIRRVERAEPALARHAWDLFVTAGERIGDDIARLVRPSDHWMRLHGGTVIGDEVIRIAASATLDPHVVVDARNGPVVVESDVHIGAHSVLVGPCAVLEGTRISAHATLKAGTVIGPGCRVGGEIGASVFQGWSNKSHDGHLGDSWVGEWANLGAATTNSNLLNTYGEVTMRLDPDGPRVRSGRQFLGCVVGDHVKTAIGTRITTGSVFGMGTMIARSSAAPTSTRRFAWLTDEGERSYRLEKFLDTARTVLARRDRELGPALEDRIRALHATAGGSAS